MEQRLSRTTLARVVLVASLACILGATLVPLGTEFQPVFVSCILCGSRGWADAVANLLLFMPLGAALAWNGRVGLRAVSYAFLLSASIELAQLIIPGRDSSLGDVTFNTLGAATGQIAALLARRWLVPDAPIASRLSLAAAALATAILSLTGALLAPAIPASTLSLWYAPNLPEMPWYHARVLTTRLGDTMVRPGVLPTRSRQLLLGGAPFSTTAIAGPPVPALGAMLVIENDSGGQLYLVGPDRDDLVLRYQTRAATWGLDQPDIRLRGAFAAVARGDTIRIDLRRHGNAWCLSLNLVQRCGLGYTVGAAWAMVLFPRHWAPWSYTLLGAMWVGGLALPIGLWARPRIESAVAVALFAGAVAVVPSLVGLAATPASEWCGAALGYAAGLALQPVLRRSLAATATGS